MRSLVIQVTMIFTTLAKSNSRKKLCALILEIVNMMPMLIDIVLG